MISCDCGFHGMCACSGQTRFSSHFYFILFFSVKMQLYVGTDSIPETETVNECVSCLASRIWVHMVSGGFERRVVMWEERATWEGLLSAAGPFSSP